MSVLIFVDLTDERQAKKGSLEALNYGVQLATQLGTDATAVVLGSVAEGAASFGKYGVKKVFHIADALLNQLDAQLYTKAIAQVVETSGASVIVFSNNMDGRSIAPRLSARLKAGLVSGAVALPQTTSGFVVKKSVFSGKAFAHVSILTDKKIIAVNPGAFAVAQPTGTDAAVEELNLQGGDTPKVKVVSVNRVKGEVPLSEAEIVVSGGRGLKGPENWNLVEDLAKLLGAATACSRPVSDSHWRPHHEHVGQTGLAIAPKLYIAIGISGAIQHLAGVNRSKIIVVINKDPEAPFFKAADYGIVGDAFEVVPKLIDEIKKLKGVA